MLTTIVQIHPLLPVFNAEDVAAVPHFRLLRLSVTDRCNFRCRYCLPEEGVHKLPHHELLGLEELVSLTRWLVGHAGIERVRLTGGEPLLRAGIETLVAVLSRIDGIREVSLTTNGSLLPRKAWALKSAGLSRVNISLDSLDKQRFQEVTRGASLESTLKGIAAAWEAGLTPIKLNSVLRRSTWNKEMPALLDYAAETGLEIRFIELMRTGTERAWCEAEFVSVDEVMSGLGLEPPPFDSTVRTSARTAVIDWHGALVHVGWITPRSHPFCNRCDRLRMDARGRLRRCLMDPTQLDLARLLRSAGPLEAKLGFDAYVASKVAPRAMDSAFAMSQVGG